MSAQNGCYKMTTKSSAVESLETSINCTCVSATMHVIYKPYAMFLVVFVQHNYTLKPSKDFLTKPIPFKHLILKHPLPAPYNEIRRKITGATLGPSLQTV